MARNLVDEVSLLTEREIAAGMRHLYTGVRFAERLLTEAKVATIPISPFYEQPPHLGVVRLCMAKRDATLDEAASRIGDFARTFESP